MTLSEVTEAAKLLEEAADPGANINFGSVLDANAGDEVRITVIATGFQPSMQEYGMPAPAKTGSGTHRRANRDQMALPMSATASGSMSGGGGNGHTRTSPGMGVRASAAHQAPPFGAAYAPFGATYPQQQQPAAHGHGIPAQVGGSDTLSWHPAASASRYTTPPLGMHLGGSAEVTVPSTQSCGRPR